MLHMHLCTKQVSSIVINCRPYFPVENDAGFELLLIKGTSHYSVHVTQIEQWIKLITIAMCNSKLLHKLIAY